MSLSRRSLLTASGAALLVGGSPTLAAERKRNLRVAHLTDTHIQPEKAGDEGVAACLRHVQREHRPDLVLFGGDVVFDVSADKPARTKLLGETWLRVVKNELSTPAVYCIGNHDIPNMKAQTDEDEAKKWACDTFGLPRRYHSFERGGWKFIVLDSVRVGGPFGYEGRLDPAQLAWLKDQLDSTPATMPVLILSHIPLLSVTGFFFADQAAGPDWNINRSLVHTDTIDLVNLFAKHPNVKLALSGHAHLIERLQYENVTYLCNGAVCGGWWGGPHMRCDNGYGVIDLFDDGTFESQYVTYGWRPRE